jgi:autotransporter strand-loop-strand O-heptosyltransferase
MFRKVNAHATFNNTGYGQHAQGFFTALEKLILVQKELPYDGDISISLLDSVGAQYVRDRNKFPSILYNAWESTEQPKGFMEALRLYDQLWVPSNWQRECMIMQGVNPQFIKVVPEGIDPDIFTPNHSQGYELETAVGTFNFLIVGKWEHRKATKEMIQCWLEVFKDVPNAVLQISADNPFPVDEYRTTEERLKGYGLESDKIEIVHFEEKEDYIRRLQEAHVFLSCSRAEGWGLPLIEAMATGIPSVALDWSGSTEYAKDAMLVRVKELKTPEHVYGMPDCPGVWAEPDFDHFKEVIWDAYLNWEKHRIKAIETSDYIRSEFSWDKAAEKAMVIFQEIEDNAKAIIAETKDQIFCVGCWPNSEEKMNTLTETINQIKNAGFPVLVTSHYALPPSIIEMADYYIYDKRNELSGDWRATYFRTKDGKREEAKATIPYHAVAVLHAIENAIDFCVGKYGVMHYMEYDVEFDLQEYLDLWRKKPEEKKMLALSYEHKTDAIQSCLFSGNIEYLNKYFPRVKTWDEYFAKYGEQNYVLEHWLVKHFLERDPLWQRIETVDYPITNRFDQIDHNVWPDDVFSCHFLDGANLSINGLSRREYDVTFSNSKNGDTFKLIQKVGTWASPDDKVFRDWHIKALLDGKQVFEHKLDLKDKNVILAMGSKALGDTMAWVPYFEEFRKKHGCHVIASTWFNDLFDYPEIEWTIPGSSHKNIYAAYEIGCFDGQPNKNPRDWCSIRMQEIATDILGLEYKEIKPKLKIIEPMKFGKRHITFSEHSTMKAKLWNRDGGWQTVIDYLIDNGYDVVSISKEPTTLKHVIAQNNKPIEETIAAMNGADFHIGLGAGPSWLAWACGIPVVMISGFSEKWCEFDNPYRIGSPNGCKPCFNDTSVKFDRGWDFCGHKNDYACTKAITPEIVIEQIEKLITAP